jgi:RHS repeat-associated protein
VQYLYEGLQSLGEIRDGKLNHRLLTGLNLDETIARMAINTSGSKDQTNSRVYMTDTLNSVIAQLNDEDNANVANSYAYSPYGESQTIGPDATNNPIQYTSRESDGTGLMFYRARYYHPVLKSFLSRDPIGQRGGRNEFTYVRGRPLNAVDPLGLWDWSFGAGFHFWAMPAPGAGGMNFSSTWKPGGGLDDATSDQAAEMVWGALVDIGVNAGITNLSNCPNGVPTSLNIGLGQYGGVQIGFKNGQFDGVSLGIGVGISSPVTYTTPVNSKKR